MGMREFWTGLRLQEASISMGLQTLWSLSGPSLSCLGPCSDFLLPQDQVCSPGPGIQGHLPSPLSTLHPALPLVLTSRRGIFQQIQGPRSFCPLSFVLCLELPTVLLSWEAPVILQDSFQEPPPQVPQLLLLPQPQHSTWHLTGESVSSI